MFSVCQLKLNLTLHTQIIGIVAHPGRISSLAVSFDGRFVFSAGGADLSVNVWVVSAEKPADPLEVNYGSLSGVLSDVFVVLYFFCFFGEASLCLCFLHLKY